ncbi:MAG TPA: hypothetical protein VN915_08345 [Elusimicrobiota bacterium]|nr:hypothetical protein [Elusimicrobiota bacterium]
MKLLRDLAVIAAAVGGAYWWTHRPAPERAPAIAGARPDLAMPAASKLPPNVGSSIETLRHDGGPVHLAGKESREQALGRKPELLGGGAVDVTGGRESEPLPDERTPWRDFTRQPRAMAAVVALFIVLYLLGTRALRKGPGGRGFTHD